MNDTTAQGESDAIDPLDTYTTIELLRALQKRSEALVFAHLPLASKDHKVFSFAHGHRTLALGLCVELNLGLRHELAKSGGDL